MGTSPDILGAIFFERNRIVIDESLDPDANPAQEGRYRYTAAHEVGHWRLHRGLFGRDLSQTSLLDGNPQPSVICRSSQAKARIELQADLYASCVLMPRKLVFAAWDETFPDRKPRVLSPAEPIDHPFVEIQRLAGRIPGAEFAGSDDQALDSFAKPFAERFSFRRSSCAFVLRSSGFCTARFHLSCFCPMAREHFFEESVKC